MYVCICNAVTDRDIRRAAASGADSLYALQDSLGVATCCGSCRQQATDILDETHSRRGALQPTLYVPTPA